MHILADKTPIEAARQVARERFAWPGGYAMGVITDDGGCLCAACVAKNLQAIEESLPEDGWHPAGAYVTDADDDGVDGNPPTMCDHCYRPITDSTTQTA